MSRRLFPLVAMALVLAGACGSEETLEPEGSSPPTSRTTAPADPASQPEGDGPVSAPASTETCGEPATTVVYGETTEGEMLAGDPFTEPLYFCVEVPPGQPSVTFTLSGLTGDLDLFVGFDTFQELSGGVGLRFSDNQGVEDEAIIVEPSVYRGELLGFDQYADVTPGPYWIEVSGDPSTFALSVVRTP